MFVKSFTAQDKPVTHETTTKKTTNSHGCSRSQDMILVTKNFEQDNF